MQGSVIRWSKVSSRFPLTSWRPATGLLSIMTPMIRRSPRATCPATSWPIWICSSWRLRQLAWLKSIRMRGEPSGLHFFGSDVDALGVVVGSLPAAQDHMGVRIAGGGEDGRVPFLGQRQEVMGISPRISQGGETCLIALMRRSPVWYFMARGEILLGRQDYRRESAAWAPPDRPSGHASAWGRSPRQLDSVPLRTWPTDSGPQRNCWRPMVGDGGCDYFLVLRRPTIPYPLLAASLPPPT